MPTILIPTDFSETAAAAFRFGSQLADALNYTVEVIHIHDGHTQDDRPLNKKGDLRSRAEIQGAIDQFIRFNLTPAAYQEVQETVIAEKAIKRSDIIGSPADAIIKLSKREDTKLIVMGGVGSGRTTSVSPIFGSIARSVALGADCPVFLAPLGGGVPSIKEVAIAFDDVDHLRKIDTAFSEIRQVLAPKMRFVHVQSKDKTGESDAAEIDLLETVVTTDFPGYPVEYDALPSGKVSDQLLLYTDEQELDLLVLGQRKLGFFKRLFIGSEASKVVDGASIAVLVV
ncbi:MAG: universal stress protein, partial [Bacteroidota bacterium]